MPTWLSIILEIVKITVPALIVFLTVYHLMKKYVEGQQQLKMIELRRQQQETTLPIRLQAYERLSLLCERMSIPNLLLRVRRDGMTASELRLALLLGIQQEYEHNITQQVYVSQQLWEIIKIARDDAVNSISLVAEKVGPEATAREFSEVLINFLSNREATGPDKALEAIKKEAGLLL
jgi:hypothetical protein